MTNEINKNKLNIFNHNNQKTRCFPGDASVFLIIKAYKIFNKLEVL